MLEDRVVLYSLVGVAVLLLATLSYNNMMSKKERQSNPPKEEEKTGDWLCKFVVHNGNVVGETVARDGGNLILKQAGVFKAVPASQTKVVGDEVVLSGDMDWEASIAAGTAWHQANSKGQDDEISAQLTRSEDVKAPALGATTVATDSEEE